MILIDYACPECGFDGPHNMDPTQSEDANRLMLWATCGNCREVFEITVSKQETQ